MSDLKPSGPDWTEQDPATSLENDRTYWVHRHLDWLDDDEYDPGPAPWPFPKHVIRIDSPALQRHKGNVIQVVISPRRRWASVGIELDQSGWDVPESAKDELEAAFFRHMTRWPSAGGTSVCFQGDNVYVGRITIENALALAKELIGIVASVAVWRGDYYPTRSAAEKQEKRR